MWNGRGFQFISRPGHVRREAIASITGGMNWLSMLAALFLVFSLFLLPYAGAQLYTGSVAGTVTDPLALADTIGILRRYGLAKAAADAITAASARGHIGA